MCCACWCIDIYSCDLCLGCCASRTALTPRVVPLTLCCLSCSRASRHIVTHYVAARCHIICITVHTNKNQTATEDSTVYLFAGCFSQLTAAVGCSGVRVVLLNAYYQFGGFAEQPLNDSQKVHHPHCALTLFVFLVFK